MKVQGSTAPVGAFSIEAIPGKTGMSLVRLYQNVHPYTEEREGETFSGFEWDEYRCEVPIWDGLAQNVEDNYSVFLETGKDNEVDRSNAALYDQQKATDSFVYSDQYMKWDGLKWVFDADNPIPLLRLPFAHGVPNAFYRYVDGKRYVYVAAQGGEITEDNFAEVMELWDIQEVEA